MMIGLFCSINAGCDTTIEESATTLMSAETEKEGQEIKIQKTQLGEISTEKQEKNVKTESTVNEDKEIKPTETGWREDTVIRQEQYVIETNTEPAHVHNFNIPIYDVQTVYHEEEGHYENQVIGQNWVVDQAAWDETEKVTANICGACGWYSTNGYDTSDMGLHILREHGGKASYYVDEVNVGTIHHDEVGHYEDVIQQVWVVDKQAWTEEQQVVIGYQCECGARE